MTPFPFSSLPAEIQVGIAKACGNNALVNLCLTSKQVNELCLRVLYRHVDLLRRDRYDSGLQIDAERKRMLDARKRQQLFVRTLMSHPEYGMHVRFLKAVLCIPCFYDHPSVGDDRRDDTAFWRAIQSLTHVQSLDVGSRNGFSYRIIIPAHQVPNGLFQSATSVRLVGHMQYGVAKSILNAINPALLKHLCLDMVQDHKIGQFQNNSEPGDKGEDGQIIALGATSGLLKRLTGRCTALRTLVLRREGQSEYDYGWHTAAEEASYIEWAAFIRSVKGTVEKFAFEHGGASLRDMRFISETRAFQIMDERFERFILPAIFSEEWPCLTIMKLRGIRSSNDQVGRAALMTKLRAVLGDAKIVLEARVRYFHDPWEPNG